MQVQGTGAGFTLLALLSGAFGLAMTIFWVVVAWRGMRALEGIRECLRERRPG